MKKADFIVQDLLSKIYQRQFAGGRLPTQRELAESYDVSRDTIQRAIRTLCDIGVVTQRQGSGIYLRDQERVNPLVFNSMTLTPYDHLSSRCLELACGPATPEEQRIFQIGGPAPVWRMRRLRSVNHANVQIEFTRMPTTLFPDLDKRDVEGSLQAYVERKGFRISHFMTTYKPMALSREQATLLGCRKSTPAMHIQTRGVLTQGRVYSASEVIAIDYSVSYIRPFDREVHHTRIGAREQGAARH